MDILYPVLPGLTVPKRSGLTTTIHHHPPIDLPRTFPAWWIERPEERALAAVELAARIRMCNNVISMLFAKDTLKTTRPDRERVAALEADREVLRAAWQIAANALAAYRRVNGSIIDNGSVRTIVRPVGV